MGFVTQIFIKPSKAALVQMPTGSLQMDQSGHIRSFTLPVSFATEHGEAIGAEVLNAFLSGERAQVALTQLTIEFPALKLLARRMRHGLMVFLVPKALGSSAETKPQPDPTA